MRSVHELARFAANAGFEKIGENPENCSTSPAI
jgi:hypothetical protein